MAHALPSARNGSFPPKANRPFFRKLAVQQTALSAQMETVCPLRWAVQQPSVPRGHWPLGMWLVRLSIRTAHTKFKLGTRPPCRRRHFPAPPDCGPAHGWVWRTGCENRRPRHSRHAPPPPRPRPARWMRRGDDRGDEGHSPGIPEPSTEAAWSPAPRSRHASPGPFHETGRASSLLRRLPLGCFCQRTSLPTGHPMRRTCTCCPPYLRHARLRPGTYRDPQLRAGWRAGGPPFSLDVKGVGTCFVHHCGSRHLENAQ